MIAQVGDRTVIKGMHLGNAARLSSRSSRRCTGITRSFESMVLSATVSTITMAVAADTPPRKPKSATPCGPWACFSS